MAETTEIPEEHIPAEQTSGSKQPEEQQEKKKLSFLWDMLDILEAAFSTIFVFMMVFTFLLRPVTVDGSSMEPTLYDNDRLLIMTTLLEPKNGSIVVIDNQKGGLFADDAETVPYESKGLGIVLVKRVIATEGQEIDIDFDNGTVTVDGKVQDEPYIKAPTTFDGGAFTYPFRVPEGYLFVMGDNRLGSTDSRSPAVGLIPENEILGVAVLRYGRDEKRCSSWFDRFAIL